MKKTVSSGTTTLEYHIKDAMGRDLAIKKVVTQDDSQQTTLEYYVYGSDRIAQIVDKGALGTAISGAEATFFLTDYLGNNRVAFNVDGSGNAIIMNAMDYYPYGKILREFDNGDGDRFLTTQHERDKETGLDYRGARYYDSDLGRFLSIDPWAAKYPEWSAYNYVMGNPLVFTDPTGKGVESTHIDKDGNVLAVFNDGDNSVYQHSQNADGGTPTEYMITKRHEKWGNAAHGKKVGETKYWDEFLVPKADGSTPTEIAPNTRIMVGTDWAELIAWGNRHANRQDLSITMNESKSNQLLDIKTNKKWAPDGFGGPMTGRLLNGQYATARSAGNYLAGMNGVTGTFQGYHISGTTYMKLAGAYQVLGSDFGKADAAGIMMFGTEYGPAPYYGEMEYSGRRIAAGIAAGLKSLGQ